jgi:hypothetical protein
MLDRYRPKHLGGRVIADEGREGITQTGACLEWSVHYLPPCVLTEVSPLVPLGGVVRYMLTALAAVVVSPTPLPSRPWIRSTGSATKSARF